MLIFGISVKLKTEVLSANHAVWEVEMHHGCIIRVIDDCIQHAHVFLLLGRRNSGVERVSAEASLVRLRVGIKDKNRVV